jgi:hypothetical protein
MLCFIAMRPPSLKELLIRMTVSETSPSLHLTAQIVEPRSEIMLSAVTYLSLDSLQVSQVISSISRMSLRHGVADLTSRSLDPVQTFGSQLFTLLFEGELSEIYRQIIIEAERGGQSTRLSLLADSPQLVTVPWELIYDRSRNSFLALSPRTPVIRRMHLEQTRQESFAVTTRLNILHVNADVDGYGDREGDESLFNSIEDRFRERVKVHSIKASSPEDIEQALRSHPCQVLHFSGTGNFAQDEYKRQIVFNRQRAPVPWERFLRILSNIDSLLLVVLSSDNSATCARDLSSLTPHVQVIGIQGLISVPGMATFERTFYDSLLQGESFEAAITRGRQDVDTMNLGARDWALIVAYSTRLDSTLIGTTEISPMASKNQEMELPNEPLLDEQSARRWRKLQRELQIDRANLSALEDRRNLLSDRGIEDIEQQIRRTRQRLEQINAEIRTLTTQK